MVFPRVPFLWVLKFCYNNIFANYGVAILLLTVLIKIILYPLDQKSYKSMKEMQKIQPLIQQLKEKYKDDPRKAQTEQMKLFKEHKVNPLGGCLPLLLQMPILIAMFTMLRNAIELRAAPFVLWIKDLSEPDALIKFETKFLFFDSLNILPILMVITFFIQQRMTTIGATAKQNPQQKLMGNLMTIFFAVIFYNFPSGLVLYFAFSTILRLIQQYMVQKKVEA